MSTTFVPDCLKYVFVFQQPEYERDLNRKEQEKLHGKVSILSEEDKTMIHFTDNQGQK